MSEPVYEFVRGVGWTIAPPYETIYTMDKTGRSIRLIERYPQPGESWIYKTPDYVRDGKKAGGSVAATEHFKAYVFESAPIAPATEVIFGRYYQKPGELYNEHYVVELVV